MNIEALNGALADKNKFQKTDWNEKESAFADRYANYITYQNDDTSELEVSTSGNGWRSGNFSFLNNIDTSVSSSRYSNLRSLNSESDSSFASERDNIVANLENQLTEAKNTLARLEAEQTASKKNAKNKLIAYAAAGGKLDATVMEAFKKKANSYDSKIRMQQVEISGIEERLNKLKG